MQDKVLMKRATKVFGDVYRIEYGMKEIFSNLKRSFCKYCCCKCKDKQKNYLTQVEKFYQQGYTVLEKELSNYEILINLRKFRSILEEVVKDEAETHYQIQKNFFDHQTYDLT